MTKETLVAKLHPKRFSEMSPKMAALVGCVLGERFTTPALVELAITGDGLVFARAEDEWGVDEWIGTVEDWDRNWKALMVAADLTEAEVTLAEGLRSAVTTDWRRCRRPEKASEYKLL